MQYVIPQEIKAYCSNFLHNLERVRDKRHAHLCFCSFSCLVEKMMITFEKKSHTEQASNAKIIKTVIKIKFYAIFYPWEQLLFARLFQGLRKALLVHSLSGPVFTYCTKIHPRNTSGLTSLLNYSGTSKESCCY